MYEARKDRFSHFPFCNHRNSAVLRNGDLSQRESYQQ